MNFQRWIRWICWDILFVGEHDGFKQMGEVKELLEEEGKFLVEFVNGGEELMSYNDLINLYDK